MLLTVFAIALGVRAIPVGFVFTPYGILPGGLSDEYYHLRRIWYSVVNFPDVLAFDPYVNFPDGGHIHWPPGFDWLAAAVARLIVGAHDQAAMELVVAWMPPILGALVAVGVAWVGRVTFGRLAGWIAGLLLAILPVSYHFSRVGMVDHHIAVALAAVALLGSAMAWLRTEPGRLGLGHAFALGLAMGVPFLAWPAFLLHVLAADAVLVVAVLAASAREAAVARARSLAVAHGLAAAVLLPFCLGPALEQYGAWSPLVLSRFQLAWFGVAAAVLGASAWLWSRSEWAATRPGRFGGAAVLALAGAGAVLLLAPGLREALFYASGWFTDAEDFHAHVAELLPLGFVAAVTRYSLLIFLFPFAWVALVQRAWRRRAWDLGLLAVWALVFLALAMHQRRFNNSFAVPYVLVWGAAVSWMEPALRDRLGGRPLRTAAVGGAAVLALLVAFEPVLRDYAPQLRHSWLAHRDPQLAIARLPPVRRAQLAAARWLRSSSPPTRGFMDPSVRPGYGVLVSWSAGHLFRYRARRPMVQDNFGVYGGRENYARAWAYYAAKDEAEALALLDRLEVRYVVADRFGAGSVRPYPVGSMTHRLAELFGSAARVRDPESGRMLEIPALAHHRLVFHARSARRERGAGLVAEPPQVSVGVWERVPGAHVVGRARPGDRVEAELQLSTAAGYTHAYRARVEADADGFYELVLPYATTGSPGEAVRTGRAYRLSSPVGHAGLAVPAAAVRQGGRVEGPDLAR
jgi:dolichyl-diphosphooligosaccharide--protein glycosyltransferase